MQIKAAGEDSFALRAVAQALLEKAMTGDLQAIKELADRTDGKVPQAITGDDDSDPIRLIHRIERAIVDPVDTNS